jgi:hypothetical protein
MSSRGGFFLKTSLLLFVIVSCSFCKAFAEGGVEVNTEKNKTSISVTGFPKNATILVVDENFNLLSVGSTNSLGKAVIKLNKEIKTVITVRTINGDYQVSNKVEGEEPDTGIGMPGASLKQAAKA